MSRLEDLPPDQQATLSLLLGQRKSYAEIAVLLGIPERAVHDRAHAALAVLAPREARELTPERREDVGEYLLGQTGVGERLATRTFLDGSAPGRAWASTVSAEIAPLSTAPLPEIPDGAAPPGAPTGAGTGAVPTPSGEPPLAAQMTPRRAGPPSSRLGGALLLAAIAAGVIVAVILIADGGGSSHSKTKAPAASASASASATGASGPTGSSGAASTGASGPAVTQRINLTPPDPNSKAVGAVEILAEGRNRAYYLAAEHLPPSNGFFYAVWLYNSPISHEALNRAPAVSSTGTLAGGQLLPANAGNYHQILLTARRAATRATPVRPF